MLRARSQTFQKDIVRIVMQVNSAHMALPCEAGRFTRGVRQTTCSDTLAPFVLKAQSSVEKHVWLVAEAQLHITFVRSGGGCDMLHCETIISIGFEFLLTSQRAARVGPTC